MPLQVQPDLKEVPHIYHFASLVHSISTMDFSDTVPSAYSAAYFSSQIYYPLFQQ